MDQPQWPEAWIPWLVQQFTDAVLQPEGNVAMVDSLVVSTVTGVRESSCPKKVNNNLLALIY